MLLPRSPPGNTKAWPADGRPGAHGDVAAIDPILHQAHAAIAGGNGREVDAQLARRGELQQFLAPVAQQIDGHEAVVTGAGSTIAPRRGTS